MNKEILLEKIDNFKVTKNYSNQDLSLFVNGYVDGSVSDEIMTAFIKSIYDNGLSIDNIANLTKIMMESGKIIDLSSIPSKKVDKHSTGGVGDKVSIILGPIIASFDIPVAKMSGRGLGFTGGTLDKLQSIPGYNAFLTDEAFIKQVNDIKVAIIGQTNDIVPADKKIYALRDEQNLVDSIPLIASSIMSKKLATGADTILLDVKCGDAAFMKTQEQAEKLASLMIDLGTHMGKSVKAEITSMKNPLGREIGNKNEILESYRFLSNEETSDDLKEVILSSCATLLVQAEKFESFEQAKKQVINVIENGKALQKFKEWIISQGGDWDLLTSKEFWKPKYSLDILSASEGYLDIFSAKTFGIVGMKLGAGREKKEDDIDFEAGITLWKKSGEHVKTGEKLFTLYSSKPINLELKDEINGAFNISETRIVNKVILNKL